jgi:imidazolonepropionase-like amidohydrolase
MAPEVPILAGTDANATPGVPASAPFGESQHHELELLVSAGLPGDDARRAATVLRARHFGLTERGAVEPQQTPARGRSAENLS